MAELQVIFFYPKGQSHICEPLPTIYHNSEINDFIIKPGRSFREDWRHSKSSCQCNLLIIIIVIFIITVENFESSFSHRKPLGPRSNVATVLFSQDRDFSKWKRRYFYQDLKEIRLDYFGGQMFAPGIEPMAVQFLRSYSQPSIIPFGYGNPLDTNWFIP